MFRHHDKIKIQKQRIPNPCNFWKLTVYFRMIVDSKKTQINLKIYYRLNDNEVVVDQHLWNAEKKCSRGNLKILLPI